MFLRDPIVSLMNKDGYDFDSSKHELFVFHPPVKVALAANGIFFEKKTAFKRFFPPFLVSALAASALVLMSLNIYHGFETEDLTTATESFSYFITLITIPLVQYSNVARRDNIVRIFGIMREDFDMVESYSQRYRDSFLSSQRQIWKLTVLWYIFVTIVFFAYVSLTVFDLLYMSLFATLDEHSIRPLIFPVWLPNDDPYRSPNFEFLFLYEVIMVLCVVQTFGVYVNTVMHVLLHCLGQIDLIIIRLESLFEGLEEQAAYMGRDHADQKFVKFKLRGRFRRISRWHNNVLSCVKEINHIFNPILSYQLTISAFVLCLNAYQVADSLDRGSFDFLFALLFGASFLQVWIPCYFGALVVNKAAKIADACWCNGWEATKLSTFARFEMQMVMSMSQIPLIIQPVGGKSLTLETFSTICSSAYSYFNMLRQLKESRQHGN